MFSHANPTEDAYAVRPFRTQFYLDQKSTNKQPDTSVIPFIVRLFICTAYLRPNILFPFNWPIITVALFSAKN